VTDDIIHQGLTKNIQIS